jgi:hypothetical protein
MAYCGPRGIPLSTFLSWSEADQEAALAWQAHESRRCGSCGTHPDDWSPQAGGDREAYHAEVHQCPGCLKVERLKQAPHVVTGPPGMHIRLADGIHRDCPRCNPET